MTGERDSKEVLRLCDLALQLQGPDREAFLAEACGDNGELRSSVDSVLLAVSDSSAFLDVPPTLEKIDLVGKQVGPYKILEEIGEGGMGSVYLGERSGEEFTQKVAIKLVRGQLFAKELIQRFHAERKILASLNHPYIAGLIDGGTTSDGMPYLVMEYVDGVTVDRYCDDNQLDVRERIKLIQQVAMAVHAAHQNLVVHRDLKPSNVLVTKDGIPKLLDFGIAKLLTPTQEEESGNTTVFGRQAMTPNYASPEQVLENKVTTASDVYTLGVLAYRLLTGERPYHIETSTHKAMVNSFESLTVPKPSLRLNTLESQDDVVKIATARSTTPTKLKKQLSGDLDNILAKALHKDPSRRYSSIANFSEDLDRYLSDLPVEARADSMMYRLSRFVSRHRFGVGVSVGAVLLLVAGLAGISWAYFQAEQARALANMRFDQVRAIANTLMFEVYDDIERVPGTGSARETLASEAQQYLETLANVPNASTQVKLEAARGYARLVTIFNRDAVSDSEKRNLANGAQTKALALLEELETSHDNTGEVLRTLAQVQSSEGRRLLSIDNNPQSARPKILQALDTFDRASSALPNDLELMAARFLAQKDLGDSYKWQNQYSEALDVFRNLIGEIETVRSSAPKHLPLIKVHADSLGLQAETHMYDNDFASAEGLLKQSLLLYDQHSELSGDSQRNYPAVILSNWRMGTALTWLDRPQESLGFFDRAIGLLNLQLARDPEDRAVGRRLAILKGTKAQAYGVMGEVDEGMDLLMQANDWFESQVRAEPDTPSAHRSVAVGYQVIADLLWDGERKTEACQWFQKTLDKWLEIDQRFGLSDFDSEQPGKVREDLSDC